MSDEKKIDPVAEATAQAAAGATTDLENEGFAGLTNGSEPDPDLAQGEKD